MYTEMVLGTHPETADNKTFVNSCDFNEKKFIIISFSLEKRLPCALKFLELPQPLGHSRNFYDTT